jgi:oxygen-independent coproporphyrinogen-3 oxidase
LINESQISEFEKKVTLEIKKNEEYLFDNGFELGSLKTLYIGGGTPSLWSMSGIEFLNKNIVKKYGFLEGHEFTIEVDPGTWTEDEINSWIEIGVNRFSIGIQTFDNQFLTVMDREHTMEEAVKLLKFMRDRELNYSIDLMLGLPDSSLNYRNIDMEISKLIHYNPSHFSVYILKTRSNYVHREGLPGDEYISNEYLKTCEKLESLGYDQYEVSNFAKDNKKSLHNLKYWNYESVACLGSNATGLIFDGKKSTRYQWKASGAEITSELVEGSSLEIEKIYMRLRTSGGLSLDYFVLGEGRRFKTLVNAWQGRGYIKSLSGNSIHLSARGYLMLDSLMDDIFNALSI